MNKTVKDVLSEENNVTEVKIIYDIWDAPDSTNRKQVNSGYITKDKAIEKYGDFIYESWYTAGYSMHGGFRADIWARKPIV